MMRPAGMLARAFLCAVTLHVACSAAAQGQPTRSPSGARESTSPPIAAFIAEASARFGVPERWIWAVMRVESAGDVTATSPAGAIGLMQVMPQTYASLRAEYGLGANAYDPHDNILAGAAYLRAMHDRYGNGGFLAAYNAGPARYDAFRSGVRPLPPETIRYVAQLAELLDGRDPVALTPATVQVRPTPETAPIFVALSVAGVQANHPLGTAISRDAGSINPADDALRPTIRTADLPSRRSDRFAADLRTGRTRNALFVAIGPRNPS